MSFGDDTLDPTNVEPADIKKMRDYIIGIRNEKATIEREKWELKRSTEAKEKELRERLKKLAERCPHVNTTYTPDASGNNDSSTDCNDCGAYLGH